MSSNPRVKSSNLQVRILKERVARSKARVGRLKTRVETMYSRGNIVKIGVRRKKSEFKRLIFKIYKRF